jgi:hypothetical protein
MEDIKADIKNDVTRSTPIINFRISKSTVNPANHFDILFLHSTLSICIPPFIVTLL